MKKTVLTYNIENVSIDTIRGKKSIIKELKRKSFLSDTEKKSIDKLNKQQKKLTSYKSRLRKSTNKEERKELRKKIRTYSKTVDRTFKTTLGVKKDRTTKRYTQTEKGKKLFRVNKYGTGSLSKSRRVKLSVYNTQRRGTGYYSDFETFKADYDNAKKKREIKDILSQYNVGSHLNEFLIEQSGSDWTRRVMLGLGISDTVSEEEFYDWLVKVGYTGD